MNSVIKHILVVSLIVSIASGNALAQTKKKKTARVQVEYFKNHKKSGQLVAKLIVKEKRYLPLSDAVLNFYSVNDSSRVLLEKIRTDKNGQAIFAIENSPKIYKDLAGVLTFEVEYNGSATIKVAKRKIAVKQGDLEISFFQKDSIKSIEVRATEFGLEDQIASVEGVDIQFYIQGTFSQLNFGKGKTDENGLAQIDFPVDMPGDTTGTLTVVAKIVEDDMLGTIETRGEINWGVPIAPVREKKRGLGDTDAPLWMVYTLIILLSAVWFHYFYVIFLIIKIKMSGKPTY